MATFTSSNTTNSVIDAAYVGPVGGIEIDTGYTGTVQLQEALTVNGTFSQAAGTFDDATNSNTLNVSGLVTVSGGTFEAGSATVAFSSNLTVSGGTFSGSTGTLNTNGVTLSSGTLTAPSGTFNNRGNWSVSGGTFTPGSLTVNFTGTSTQTVNAGGASFAFNNVSYTGNGTLQITTTPTVIGGNFSVSGGGTVDDTTTSQAMTINGLTTVQNGTIEAGSATVNLSGGLKLNGGTFTGSTGTVNANGVSLSSGTLTAPSGTFSDRGNWSVTGGTFTPGSNTVNFTGTGTQQVHAGGASPAFNNVNYTGNGTLQITGTSVVIGGTFTNSGGGTVDDTTTSQAMTINGLTTLASGTFEAGSATLNFNGGLSLTGGTFTGSTGTVNANGVTLSSGTLTAPSGPFNDSGNWMATGGTFTPGSGTVTLNGTGQTISGSTTFHNLTKSVTSADTLTFAAGSTQIVTGTLTLNGAAGQLLKLRSSTPGTQWKINPTGTLAVSFVDVQDSDNLNGTDINPPSSVNSGDNTNWFSATLDVTSGTLTYNSGDNQNDALTITVAGGNYTFTVSAGVISLTSGAIAAGWSGSGTATVTGKTLSVTADFDVNQTNTGDSITTSGAISVPGNVNLSTAGGASIVVDSVSGTKDTLTAGGSISSAGLNAIAASGTLTLSAATGMNLFTSTPSLAASNSTSGNITITQVASPAQALTISGVKNNAAGGAVSVTNLGGTLTVAGASGSIASAVGTGAAPVIITTTSPHGLSTGTVLQISGVQGFAAVNSTFTITVISSTAFTLNGTTGAGFIGSSTPNTGTWAELSTFTTNNTSRSNTLTLAATGLTISTPISSGTARTTLENSVAGTAFDLGTKTAGVIGLTQSDLNNVTAGVLQIGSPNAGTINVSAAIGPFMGTNVLTLSNNGSITETTGSLGSSGSALQNLRVSSAGPVTLTAANNVSAIAADTTTGALTFNNGANAISVGTVDGVVGLTSGSTLHLITSSAAVQAIAQSAPVTAASGLAVESVGGVALSNASNAVNSVAASVTAGTFLYMDSGALSGGGTVDGVTGVVASTEVFLISVGNLTVDVVSSPTVFLTSNTGSIASAGANAIGGVGLFLSAATGINVDTSISTLHAANSTSGNISVTQLASPAKALNLQAVSNSVAGGSLSITNQGGSITVSNGNSSNNGTLTLAATGFTINNPITSGTARTILENSVAGTPFDLGTKTAGTIGLTQTELNEVTAGVLQIGSPTAGTINVSAAIGPFTGTNVLMLDNNATITEGASGSLGSASALPNLFISSTGPVTLTSTNNVGTIAAGITGALTFNNGSNALTIGAVDGYSGIGTTNSNITLTAGSLSSSTIVQELNAGNGTITLTASTGAISGSGIVIGGLLTANAATSVSFSGSNTVVQVSGSAAAGNFSLIGNTQSLSVAGVTASGNTVTVTALAITQGSGTITAANLVLSAVNGIGASAASVNTAISALVAQNTTSGGIFISNTGTLTIGFTGDPFQGVSDRGNLDPISLTNAGTLNITTKGEVINAAAGNVTLTTTTGDIVTGGQPNGGFVINIGGDAALATLTAAGNISLGANGSAGSVAGAGPIVLTAVGNITVDNSSIVEGFGPSNGVTATAGGNISILATTLQGAQIITVNNPGTPGGNISLTTGTGGVFTLNSGTNGQINSAVETGQSSGNITISADSMVINNPITTGSTTAGIVTLTVATAGHGIDLGTNPSSGKLGLAQGDLNHVTAGTLRIGSAAAGDLTISAPITAAGTGWSTLSLITGGGILDTNTTAPDFTATSLALQAVNGIDTGGNATLKLQVGIVAASNTTAGSIQLAQNSGNLTIGTVDGVVGVKNTATTNLNFTVVRTLNGNLTIANNVATTDNLALTAEGSQHTLTNQAAVSNTSNGNILLYADLMSLASGTVAVQGSNLVLLQAVTSTQNTSLGTTVAGTLSLLQTDLNTITAGVLAIGSLTGQFGNPPPDGIDHGHCADHRRGHGLDDTPPRKRRRHHPGERRHDHDGQPRARVHQGRRAGPGQQGQRCAVRQRERRRPGLDLLRCEQPDPRPGEPF